MIPLHKAGGNQTDNAKFQVLSANDDDLVFGKINGFRDRLNGFLKDPRLKLFPLVIEAVEALRNFPCLFLIARGQELDALTGKCQPPACIDPGGKLKCNIGGRRCPLDIGNVKQCLETGTPCLRHRSETIIYNHAVFVPERHNIRHRCQRSQIPKPFNRLCSPKCMNKFKGNARTAQIAERILPEKRVQNRLALGKLGAQLVMIGDDDPHSQFFCPGRFLCRGDAAVYRNQKLRTLCNFLNGIDIESISLTVPVRNIIIHLCSLFP